MISGAFVVLGEGSDTIESPPIGRYKFDICDMSSVLVIIVNQIIFNECAISSVKDVFELFNASMHPF